MATTDSREQPIEGPSLKGLALFTVLVFSFLIISSRLATFLHEAIGHGLTALISGGECRGIHVSAWGGGHADCQLRADSGSLPGFFYHFGGIIINLISGLVSVAVYEKMKKKGAIALFLAIFSLISILGAYSYLVVGLYYDVGDPKDWISHVPLSHRGLFLAFSAIAPFLSYYFCSRYLAVHECTFPSARFPDRLVKVVGTLGLSLGIYGMVFVITSERLVTIDAPRLYYEDAEKQIRQKKLERMTQDLLEKNPDMSNEELNRHLQGAEIRVAPDEVPMKFPMIAVLALLYVSGFLISSFTARASSHGSGKTWLSRKIVIINGLIAACLVGFLSALR